MARDFRQEAYDLIVRASHDCTQADINSVFQLAAERLGKELKAMHDRSRNFELMLIRVLRRYDAMRKAGSPREAYEEKLDPHEEKLDAAMGQARDLLGRLGGDVVRG